MVTCLFVFCHLKGSCLKQGNKICTHRKLVNLYISYETRFAQTNDFVIGNCLFGAVW